MSFRVNNNINAMNAMRNLSATSMEFSKSINRLSTGLRINSAADDPAGLIISEKFRAQIGGLTQAIKNSQDAINYSKTAEGAFNEVNTLLGDARTLAVASSNSATLSSSQVAADQAQLNSIISSITRIAQNTQYGSKNLLDGSAGTQSAVTAGASLSSLSIGGSFGGTSLSSSATVTLTSVTAATQGLVSSKVIATAATAVTAGSFSINGVTFNASASTTAADVVNMVNQASQQTGVTATYNTGTTKIDFASNSYGSKGAVNLVDSAGVVLAAAGSAANTGTDALATATIVQGATTLTSLFTGGIGGADGVHLTDASGNTLSLTAAGNTTSGTAVGVGQIITGSATFQIGGNAGQTASLSLNNVAASQLGTGVAAGVNLSNLDLSTASGASLAIQVIDKAIDDVTSARGKIGNFQRNVLESNVRSLGTAKENLSASESSIRDTDIAAEMTNYTKLQILQQAGMSVLSQANQAPQAVLKLLGN